jgi:hypothetical protein
LGDEEAVFEGGVSVEDYVYLRGGMDGDGGVEVVNGVVIASCFEGDIAHLGDEVCIAEEFGAFAEDAGHLGTGFEVKLLGGVTQPFLVFDLGTSLDAQEGIVRSDMSGVNIVDVVGANDAEVVFFSELEKFRVEADLFSEAVIHQLDEKIFASEDVEEAGEGGLGSIPIVVEEGLGDDALHAAGESDEAFGVGSEVGEVGALFTVKGAVDVGIGDEFDKVLVAFEIFCKEAHVEATFLGAFGAFGVGVVIDEVDFATEKRFQHDVFVFEDALCSVPEVECPKQVTVVCDGDRLLSEGDGAVHESVNAAASVEEAIVGVDMKVDEVGACLFDWLGCG